jgi:predicted AAA+ superfamily ATPase
MPRPRLLERRVRAALSQFRVVGLIGPRQVGKSTLCAALGDRHYVTLDDLGVLDVATRDPRGFVAGLPVPATIDEVQRAPELLLAIKERVDRHPEPGMFLLTGSSRLDTLRGIRESLAGRVAILPLRPMVRAELRDDPGESPIERLLAFTDPRTAAATYARLAGPRITASELLTGGFPEPALVLDDAGRRAWFREYRRSYVERDVPAVLRVEDVPAFGRFLQACAATSAQLLNVTDLARDIGVSVDTARRWLGVLEITLVAERRQPLWRNVRTRLVKSPKLFLADSGLTGAILGVDPWSTDDPPRPAGPLLETWIHAQLATWCDLADAELAFYRTHSQVEVDFVVSRGGRSVAIEVKSAATVRAADAKSIEAFIAQFPECRLGVVLYGGETTFPLSEHVVAVPLGAFFA